MAEENNSKTNGTANGFSLTFSKLKGSKRRAAGVDLVQVQPKETSRYS